MKNFRVVASALVSRSGNVPGTDVGNRGPASCARLGSLKDLPDGEGVNPQAHRGFTRNQSHASWGIFPGSGPHALPESSNLGVTSRERAG